MSAEFTDYIDGILSARISGKLTYAELVALQHAASDIIKLEGKARILVIADNFQGWEREGDWGDLSFQSEHDAQIDKLAIIGDREWQNLALLFASKGIRKFPIEYYEPDELAKARAWLFMSLPMTAMMSASGNLSTTGSE